MLLAVAATVEVEEVVQAEAAAVEVGILGTAGMEMITMTLLLHIPGASLLRVVNNLPHRGAQVFGLVLQVPVQQDMQPVEWAGIPTTAGMTTTIATQHGVALEVHLLIHRPHRLGHPAQVMTAQDLVRRVDDDGVIYQFNKDDHGSTSLRYHKSTHFVDYKSIM